VRRLRRRRAEARLLELDSVLPFEQRIGVVAARWRPYCDAAAAGARLVLAPRAVLTPMARDRARSLGVEIEKERPC